MYRNKEIRQFAAVFGAIAVAAAAVGFAIGAGAGMAIIGTVAALGLAFFVFTRARYKSLARIAEQIDRVLHGGAQLFTGDMDEGELSILQSEVTKMTQRIAEQNAALKKEKAHLAESLADIAHQLRTPLTSISLISSLLKKSAHEDERQALLRENEKLLAQMDWLVSSLLKLSRLDAGIVTFARERLDVSGVISAAARPLAIPLELRDITLRVDVPGGASVLGDSQWLPEAIQNLLKNCMESAGDHGTIMIRCEDNPLYTQIVIRDSGAGFSVEELPRLFDRFYRGKSTSAAGYGIGLALCKGIITRQGGSITAKNHPQGGAMFTIRFPR